MTQSTALIEWTPNCLADDLRLSKLAVLLSLQQAAQALD